jgi:hypothetical protein
MLDNPEKYIGRVARVRALGLYTDKDNPKKPGALRAPSFQDWHLDKGMQPIEEKTSAQGRHEPHDHAPAPVGSVAWHFHNHEHGYRHCCGSKAHPYNITPHPEGHAIDVPVALGHGRLRKPVRFRFPRALPEGGFLLESGEALKKEK